jgi:uncharacterized delta-60 repeat protein
MHLRPMPYAWMRKSWLCWVLGCGVVALGLSGCPDATDCANPANAERCGKDKVEVLLTVSSSTARMRPGDRAELAATIERKGDWEGQGPITVNAVDLIAGVTMPPVDIASDATQATLKFSASEAVPQGVFPFQITADPADTRISSAEVALEAVIPGPPGTPDLSFGADGTVIVDSHVMSISASAIDALGRVVFAGSYTSSEDERRPMVMRLNQDGSIDEAFREKAAEGPPPPLTESYHDVVVTESEVLVIGWGRTDDETPVSAVSRYDVQGALDTTFGSAGSTILENIYYDAELSSFLVRRKSDILVATRSEEFFEIGPADSRVVSLSLEGRVNNAFGVSSLPKLQMFPIQCDDDLLYWPVWHSTGFWTLRGDVAAPFASDLTALTQKIQAHDELATSSSTRACDVDSLNRLVCVGVYTTDDYVGAWYARVDEAGILDPTFGTGGLMARPDPNGLTSEDGIVVLADNTFVTCEYDSSEGTDTTYYLAKYAPDGSSDTKFGLEGRVLVGSCSSGLLVDHRLGTVVVHYRVEGSGTRVERYWL